jgi:hypothetical protein
MQATFTATCEAAGPLQVVRVRVRVGGRVRARVRVGGRVRARVRVGCR